MRQSPARVAVNGYGVIGKRVADAVALQDDMKLLGVADIVSDYRMRVAVWSGKVARSTSWPATPSWRKSITKARWDGTPRERPVRRVPDAGLAATGRRSLRIRRIPEQSTPDVIRQVATAPVVSGVKAATPSASSGVRSIRFEGWGMVLQVITAAAPAASKSS